MKELEEYCVELPKEDSAVPVEGNNSNAIPESEVMIVKKMSSKTILKNRSSEKEVKKAISERESLIKKLSEREVLQKILEKKIAEKEALQRKSSKDMSVGSSRESLKRTTSKDVAVGPSPDRVPASVGDHTPSGETLRGSDTSSRWAPDGDSGFVAPPSTPTDGQQQALKDTGGSSAFANKVVESVPVEQDRPVQSGGSSAESNQ